MRTEGAPWYQCPICGLIYNSNVLFGCTPHWWRTPTRLLLTTEEVVWLVWPHVDMIRTTEYPELQEAVTRVREEVVWAIGVFIQAGRESQLVPA